VSRSRRGGDARRYSDNQKNLAALRTLYSLFLARVACNLVTVEPGAGTGWYTHPLGQTLIVTAACGSCSGKAGRSKSIHLVHLNSTP